MIPHRNSLRARVLWSFLAAALLLGPLAGLAALFVTVETQEWAAKRAVRAQLDAVTANPAAHEPVAWGRDGQVQALPAAATGHIPEALATLPDGIHEHESGPDAWLIGLRTTGDDRFAVIRDIAPIEQRERQGVRYALLGAGGATVLGVLLAAFVARRLTAPLETLARLVHEDVREPAPDPDQGTREIRTLAAALVQYRQRTERALDRERRFAADVSHELRTPIAIVANAAELLRDDPQLGERSRRAARRIEQATRRMEETTTTLLALVREPTPDGMHRAVDLAERVRAVVTQETSAADRGHPRPVIHPTLNAAPTVRAPPAVVDVVIGNLLRNALRHARPSTIRIVLEADELRIEDDGIGTPEPVITAVNQAATADDAADTGVGLSLVLRLCGRFGWSLQLEANPSGGSIARWRFGTLHPAGDGAEAYEPIGE